MGVDHILRRQLFAAHMALLDAQCHAFWAGARAFHLVNLAFHAANAVFVYLWFRGATGAVWRSALVAAVFAVHPLRVESVAWVVERKDVLTAFFAPLAMLAYFASCARRIGDGIWRCCCSLAVLCFPSRRWRRFLAYYCCWTIGRSGDGHGSFPHPKITHQMKILP